MKYLIIFLLLSFKLYAGTCTSVSRTDLAANATLTSSEYNTSLNTIYTAHNAFDGGCVTDGTLEKGALLSTDFSPLFKGITRGCMTYGDSASTLSIEKCLLSVNTNFVATTGETAVNWTHLDTGSEAASTLYYVYASSASTGSTLTPIISTTKWNDDGYDSSNNKAMAVFYNNGSANIATSTVYQFEELKKNNLITTIESWRWGASDWSYVAGKRSIDYCSGTSPTFGCYFITGFWQSPPTCTVKGVGDADVYAQTLTESEAGGLAGPTVVLINIGNANTDTEYQVTCTGKHNF